MNSNETAREEYVTIIAPNAGAAMAQFKARGLDIQGYAIAGPVGRHRFAVVPVDGPTEELFAGAGMIAATFSRRVAD